MLLKRFPVPSRGSTHQRESRIPGGNWSFMWTY